MMRAYFFIVPAITACLGLAGQQIRADVIADDSFNYGAGPISGATGGRGFLGSYSFETIGADGWSNVTTGNLGFTDAKGWQLRTDGNQLSTYNGRAYRMLDTASAPAGVISPSGYFGTPGSRVYVSFLANQTSGLGGISFGGVSLWKDGTEKMFFGNPGFDGNPYWGIDPMSGPATRIRQSSVLVDQTPRLLVGRIDFGFIVDTVRLYVDPELDNEPLFASVAPFSVSHLEFNRIRVGSLGTHNVDELRMGTTYADVTPKKPPQQKIYLAWDQDLPVLIERKRTWLGEDKYPVTSTSKTMPHATVAASDRAEIEARVAQIFADSGIGNIEFVTSPTDATTVYFAAMPSDPKWGIGGQAYQGIDRFNKRRTDSVAVFVQEGNEINALSVTHEVGHALGLRHVNPGKAADPDNLEVMDYDPYQPGKRHQFINAVSSIFDLGESKTHNPLYHLRRYVDGWSHEELVAAAINPGSWDRSLVDRFRTLFSFSGSDRMLYDVNLLSGADEDSTSVVAHYDSILLSQLALTPFELNADTPFELLASSTVGGEWDLVLSTGDPFIAGNSMFLATDGIVSASLQQITGPGTYATLADASVEMTAVPEPAALPLLALALVGLLRRVRLQSKVVVS